MSRLFSYVSYTSLRALPLPKTQKHAVSQHAMHTLSATVHQPSTLSHSSRCSHMQYLDIQYMKHIFCIKTCNVQLILFFFFLVLLFSILLNSHALSIFQIQICLKLGSFGEKKNSYAAHISAAQRIVGQNSQKSVAYLHSAKCDQM